MIFYKHKTDYLIQISGPDSVDFLHRLTTLNFKNFELNQIKHGFLLSGKANVKALFSVKKTNVNEFLFVCPEPFSDMAYDEFQKMHFAENLQIKKIPSEVYEVRNLSEAVSGFEAIPWPSQKGIYFFNKNEFVNSYPQAREVRQNEWLQLLLKNKIPVWQKDWDENSIVLEAPYEDCIDRNKGCYPGQEVIEKIYTYGRLPKKIYLVESQDSKIQTAVIHDFTQVVNLKCEILESENSVGTLTSLHWDGSKWVGLATLKKNFTDKAKTFVCCGLTFKVSEN